MSVEQLARLSPAVHQLLSDIEAGQVDGELATKYTAALKEASRATETEDGTDYLFILDGHQQPESHPVIFLSVRAVDGRIEKCGTGVPCW